MKLKNSYFYTLREDSKNEDSVSGNLLVRSGMIKKSSAGVYMFLPMGLKVLNNVSNIVREEMNKIGSEELLMPVLIQEELFEASGRRESFKQSIFTLRDRFDRKYALGPTHEEMFVLAASNKIKSYKDIPFSLYQLQTKFRDEARPRYGLIRVREFIMKDAYTFDKDLDDLNESYNGMYNAYKNIFNRIGINYTIVKADTGVMGGILSEEFQAITDIGEDILVLCDSCDYASNIEIAECIEKNIENNELELDKELVNTGKSRTIEELTNFFNEKSNKFLKTLIYKVDNKFVAVLINGEDEVNEVKLQKLYKATNVELAEAKDVERITNAEVGFAGPIGLNIELIADNKLKSMKNFIIGANKTDYHYKNVNINDFKCEYADLRYIKEGDICPKCGKKIVFKKGIEVGNTFKLGTKYSEALGLNYLDENNALKPVVMGSYGIGIGRCISSLIEQNHDDKGIIWPINIAPYKVCVVVANSKDDTQSQLAEAIYKSLIELNIDTILDDRDERLGVKLNDMDLIGIPLRILVGNKCSDNIVEFKQRRENNIEEININDIIEKIKKTIN
ncbi:MAG: proline--tRNA ligase [Bacilli bacterium]|nr:proline--tRNA ligase [Bacilli bacterium]